MWQRVGQEAAQLGGKRALIVADEFLVRSDRAAPMVDLLSESGVGAVVYRKEMAEPTDGQVERGLELLREGGCDLVVGFGGGSAIDAAKAIAVMADNPGSIADRIRESRIGTVNARLPLIAVSTTAGTGSEVSRFTVIADTSNDVKMLISDPHLIPDVAIVDPTLSLTCPPAVTASAGIDALIHAIEAYISRRATPLTNVLALSAIGRISAHLREAWLHGDNLEARSQVMLGSLEAGMAFSNSSVALVHGMSQPVGAHFHIPHGLSNAMLLPVVMEYSLSGAPERYADIARAMGQGEEGASGEVMPEEAVTAAHRLNQDLEVPSLSEFGVEPQRLRELAPVMARDALASGSPANNPRVPTAQEVEELYLKAL
jgi:alcohol dehydrogenase class IV